MSWLCRHKWQEEKRYFVPPLDLEGIDIKGSNPRTLFQITSGYTIIVLKCSKCEDIKAKELMGDAT